MDRDPGWAYTTPASPARTCNLCRKPNDYVNGSVVCLGCDFVPLWPKVQAEQDGKA